MDQKKNSTNEFLAAGGGEYSTEAGYSEKFDFHTEDSTLVGITKTYNASISNENLSLSDTVGGLTKTWKRISNNKNELSGNWVITGRERDGELRKSIPGARRTIKILGGDRFQWVAFNTDTGEFFGTGGGTYTAKDGKYIENIGFFSRNNTRVGAELNFKYSVKNREWHHSGKSSNGKPIYEVWSPYRDFFDKN